MSVAHAVGDPLNVAEVGLAGLVDLSLVVMGGKSACDGHQIGASVHRFLLWR